ncbi:hypothetical protein LCGC14_2725910, partial [marine sediment metagenome]
MTEQKPSPDFSPESLPKALPILPLFDAVLFPKMVLPLMVMQNESIRLIDEAMSTDRIIGLLLSKKPDIKNTYSAEELYAVGTSALILKMAKSEDQKAQLLVQGLSRFKVKNFTKGKPYLQATVEHIKETEKKDTKTEAFMSNLIGLFTKIVDFSPGLPKEIGAMAKSIQEVGTLTDMVASTINLTFEEKQKILEISDAKKRIKEVSRLANHQLEILELGNKIQSQVKGDMDKKQREYFLRQQMEAIKEELGEKDDTSVEIDEYRAKIEEKKLPDEAKKEAERELSRLSRMHPSSSEYTVASTYLDWLTSLPWQESTKDNLNIKKARKI